MALDQDSLYGYVWRVLEWEGGYSNKKTDRGGETYRGITWRTYQAFCRQNNVVASRANLRSLSNEEILAIYIEIFIKPGEINLYESEWVREVIFDASIMHGQRAAIKLSQRALNKAFSRPSSWMALKIDGISGPRTCAAYSSAWGSLSGGESAWLAQEIPSIYSPSLRSLCHSCYCSFTISAQEKETVFRHELLLAA